MYLRKILPVIALFASSLLAFAQVPDAPDNPDTVALLCSGQWKFHAATWGAVRVFQKDGTFAGLDGSQSGHWSITATQIILKFDGAGGDGHVDTLNLPLKGDGTTGKSHRGADMLATLQGTAPAITAAASASTPAPTPSAPVTRKPKVLIALLNEQDNFSPDYASLVKDFEEQIKKAGYAVDTKLNEAVTEQDLQDYDVFFCPSLQMRKKPPEKTDIFPINIFGEILADKNKILVVRTEAPIVELRKATERGGDVKPFENYRLKLFANYNPAMAKNASEYSDVQSDSSAGCTVITWEHVRTLRLPDSPVVRQVPPSYFSSPAGFEQFAKTKLMPVVLQALKQMEASRSGTTKASGSDSSFFH